jgi:hypothetical protein
MHLKILFHRGIFSQFAVKGPIQAASYNAIREKCEFLKMKTDKSTVHRLKTFETEARLNNI